MKIALRILFGYFLILGLAAWFVLNVFVQEVRPGVKQTLEDTLVDTAYLLAELLAPEIQAGQFNQGRLAMQIKAYSQRSIDVKIHGFEKQTLDYRITIVNVQGTVIFDSEGKTEGQDFSRWNDVYRTLRGEYGARSTRVNQSDDGSSVMHVAAPIVWNNKIIGALTVSKASDTVQPFVERSQRKILRAGFILLGVSLLIGVAFAAWLARDVARVRRFAQAAARGDKTSLPKMGRHELGDLGRSVEIMRVQIEGKEYAQGLLQTFAHELKSPIAAVQASAELLKENLAPAEKTQFLNHILQQSARQQTLLARLLELIQLEKQQTLRQFEPIYVQTLMHNVAADAQAKLLAKQIQLTQIEPPAHSAHPNFKGDALLLRQALGNLIDNAIDFSPSGEVIELRCVVTEKTISFIVSDVGQGVPDYAMPRVFERFYSLPRPDGLRSKSHGLGLPFVREVAALHGGSITLENVADKGARANLQLPI